MGKFIAFKLMPLDNSAKIMDSLKLFPLIGEDATGLDHYASYLRSKIARVSLEARKSYAKDQDPNNPPSTLPLITLLFEKVVRLLEENTEIVVKSYGPGKVIYIIQQLQHEIESQAIVTLDLFADTWSLQKRVLEIQNEGARKVGTKDVATDIRELDSLLNELAQISQRKAVFWKYMVDRAAVFITQ